MISTHASSLTRSDSKYWDEKEKQLEDFQQRYLEKFKVAAQAQEDRNIHYSFFIGNLKDLFFPGDLEELAIVEAFYNPLFFNLLELDRSFLAVLENLSELKNSVSHIDPDDEWYSDCRVALINLIELTKQMCEVELYNPKPHFRWRKQLDFAQQVSTLATTIANTNAVICNPGDINACANLTSSLLVMQSQMETRTGAFRRNIYEKPLLHKFICAAGVILGASLFIAGALLHPMTFGMSSLISAAGVLLLAVSIGLYTIKSDNKEERNTRERGLAYYSMDAYDSITQLSAASPAFFSETKRSPEITFVMADENGQNIRPRSAIIGVKI